jgi:hypothetical protein
MTSLGEQLGQIFVVVLMLSLIVVITALGSSLLPMQDDK